MDETLIKLRDQVYARVEGSVVNDEWLQQKDWLNLYLQFKMLDMLASIDSRLDSIDSSLVSMNPLYK
jgi:hypothetical protein